jgi:hypothetical protein
MRATAHLRRKLGVEVLLLEERLALRGHRLLLRGHIIKSLLCSLLPRFCCLFLCLGCVELAPQL